MEPEGSDSQFSVDDSTSEVAAVPTVADPPPTSAAGAAGTAGAESRQQPHHPGTMIVHDKRHPSMAEAGLKRQRPRRLPPPPPPPSNLANATTTTPLERHAHPHPPPQQQRRGLRMPLFHLRGGLVGLDGSGKRTLLQRLEGKDPFSIKQDTNGSGTVGVPVPGSGPRSGGGSGKTTMQQVNVPYQPLPTWKVWDRIRLQVQASTSVPVDVIPDNDPLSSSSSSLPSSALPSSSSSSSSSSLDFLVVLLNPKIKVSKFKKYLKAILQEFLAIQGYQERRKTKSNEEEEEEDAEARFTSINTSTTTTTGRPFCLCLLLNFRDLGPVVQDDDNKDDDDAVTSTTTTKRGWIRESEVTSMTMELLQQEQENRYPILDTKKLLLQFARTSLKNCYGLNILHHFIYQSYLYRKQWDMEQRLLELYQIQAQSKHCAMESYPEFLHRIQDDNGDNTQSNNNKNISSNGHHAQARGPTSHQEQTSSSMIARTNETRREGHNKNNINNNQLASDAEASPRYQEPSSFTRTTTKTPIIRNSMLVDPSSSSASLPTNSRASLEAFLALSDDEEEDEEEQEAVVVEKVNQPGLRRHRSSGRHHPGHALGRVTVIDSDSDDDNDFFLSGENPPPTPKAKEEEEDNNKKKNTATIVTKLSSCGGKPGIAKGDTKNTQTNTAVSSCRGDINSNHSQSAMTTHRKTTESLVDEGDTSTATTTRSRTILRSVHGSDPGNDDGGGSRSGTASPPSSVKAAANGPSSETAAQQGESLVVQEKQREATENVTKEVGGKVDIPSSSSLDGKEGEEEATGKNNDNSNDNNNDNNNDDDEAPENGNKRESSSMSATANVAAGNQPATHSPSAEDKSSREEGSSPVAAATTTATNLATNNHRNGTESQSLHAAMDKPNEDVVEEDCNARGRSSDKDSTTEGMDDPRNDESVPSERLLTKENDHNATVTSKEYNSTPENETTHVAAPSNSMDNDDNDSDDEFFIGGTASAPGETRQGLHPTTRNDSTPKQPVASNGAVATTKTTTTMSEIGSTSTSANATPKKAGLSSAALAAIAAAQKEAESMLLLQQNSRECNKNDDDDDENGKAEKKKKKKKVGKKIKKRARMDDAPNS